MSIFEKLETFASHARDETIGLLNPNRRHDDPEENRQDEICAEMNAGHRFNSFATEREGNFVKWHIDGHDYFWVLSKMLDSACEAIFIQTPSSSGLTTRRSSSPTTTRASGAGYLLWAVVSLFSFFRLPVSFRASTGAYSSARALSRPCRLRRCCALSLPSTKALVLRDTHTH
ncbi:hypothetical protein B0H13DRAFT_391775 [Mycena leptocephala]|nr:hypothetical protein B0H13DRAFT_391775 [Mycena leptocephala]